MTAPEGPGVVVRLGDGSEAVARVTGRSGDLVALSPALVPPGAEIELAWVADRPGERADARVVRATEQEIWVEQANPVELAGRILERRRPAWPALARLSDARGERTVSIRDVSQAGLSVFEDRAGAGEQLHVVLLAPDGSAIGDSLAAVVAYVDDRPQGSVTGLTFCDPALAEPALRRLAA